MAVGLFEFVDVDIVAAGIDDYLLGAPDDIQHPLFVETPEISRMQPSVAQDFVRRRLVAVITRHHVRPAGDDLSNSVRLAVQLYFDSVERTPDRTDDQGLVGMRCAQNRRRFGKTVAFEQPDSDIVEELGHTAGQGGPAAHREPEPSAERLMRLAKEDRSCVDGEVAIEAAIQLS